jgi:hypothetical protein
MVDGHKSPKRLTRFSTTTESAVQAWEGASGRRPHRQKIFDGGRDLLNRIEGHRRA